MKRKTFFILLGIVFVLFAALALFVEGLPELFSSYVAFPFEQIGAGLRALSLTGSVGNGVALAICVGISLIPVILALCTRREKSSIGERIVLCCTGVVAFIVLLCMINPTEILSAFPGFTMDLLPVVKGSLGYTVWSFVVLCLMLKLLKLFRDSDTHKLLRYLRIALYALCLLFDAVIALSCVPILVNGISDAYRCMDGLIAVLRFVASSLPYILDIIITLSAITLLETFMSDDKTDTVQRADALSRRCCLALGITAVSTVILNVVQLLLSNWLSNISVSVDIPFISLAFVLLILLLSRLIAENRRLRDDNDLFI